ncbi:MAG TPA: pantetheine-phosphate adenylyltransferase [Salinimicrobium sp.]|nr:pantetheine-phosphate adenylyltransferase [Salinimicrobium sp.]
MRKAVFPGSFDPVTLGHIDIIERALPLFDEIILAIGVNADKKLMFSLEERMYFLEKTFKEEPKISIEAYEGLTVDFCQKHEVSHILRGLRNSGDFDYEKAIGQTNFKMSGVETVFLITSSGKSHISSSIVRDLIRNEGDYEFMVPRAVVNK